MSEKMCFDYSSEKQDNEVENRLQLYEGYSDVLYSRSIERSCKEADSTGKSMSGKMADTGKSSSKSKRNNKVAQRKAMRIRIRKGIDEKANSLSSISEENKSMSESVDSVLDIRNKNVSSKTKDEQGMAGWSGERIIFTLATAEEKFVFSWYKQGRYKFYSMRVQFNFIKDADLVFKKLTYQSISILIYNACYFAVQITEVWQSMKKADIDMSECLVIVDSEHRAKIIQELPAWQYLLRENFHKETHCQTRLVHVGRGGRRNRSYMRYYFNVARRFIFDYIAAAYHTVRRQLAYSCIDIIYHKCDPS